MEGMTFIGKFQAVFHHTMVFQITNNDPVKRMEAQLIEESYVESHNEFLKKNKNPLCLNQECIIQYQFRKSENINPTKASHLGMNPIDHYLANNECAKLLKFELIKP